MEASGATFSPCRKYRYALWRKWQQAPRASMFATGRLVMFIGLNPSTADETTDDQTIRRCVGFAKRFGYTGIVMCNAFGYRATAPRDMFAAGDPIGRDNDSTLLYWSKKASRVVAAWGVHCPNSRAAEILKMLNRPVYCLGKTKLGHPRHPSRLPNAAPLELFFDEGLK